MKKCVFMKCSELQKLFPFYEKFKVFKKCFNFQIFVHVFKKCLRFCNLFGIFKLLSVSKNLNIQKTVWNFKNLFPLSNFIRKFKNSLGIKKYVQNSKKLEWFESSKQILDFWKCVLDFSGSVKFCRCVSYLSVVLCIYHQSSSLAARYTSVRCRGFRSQLFFTSLSGATTNGPAPVRIADYLLQVS